MYIIFVLLILLVLATLTGFIFIQIKARPIWRLSSLAFVLVFSCWACSFYSHITAQIRFGEYIRGTREFVQAVDQLATKGRTNDIHQVCLNFLDMVWTPDNTNFDRMVTDTLDLAFEHTLIAPLQQMLDTDFDSIQRIEELSAGVQKLLPSGMANPNEGFNATDVVNGKPSRRLILAGHSSKCDLVCYEHGGYGYHLHFLIFTNGNEGTQ